MICRRCGRIQPAPSSPCPKCEPGLLGSASSIPHDPPVADGNGSRTRTPVRGGDAEPSKLDTREIRDPVLRSAVEAAYAGWARKYPELLEDLDA